jgi:GTP-binding protein HflX
VSGPTGTDGRGAGGPDDATGSDDDDGFDLDDEGFGLDDEGFGLDDVFGPGEDVDLDDDRSGDAGATGGGADDLDDLGGATVRLRDVESHRGAFGEFGGESGGLIERAFRERIVLVGVAIAPRTEDDVEDSLDELSLLVDTAGADEVARVVQRRRAPEPATYIGSGKAAELARLCEAVDADTVVFDDELSPAQQRNLEKLLGRTAIDRTAVILDIFAQNAHSQEGMAQVELAQLRYLQPRLRGRGKALSQQAGGIGTRRGPGETQLEIDRRRLVRRIHKLETQLRTVAGHRDTQRKARRRSRVRQVAIVGYTNAGKSTLLNRLTDAGVLVEDRLFATLDATTRRMELPGGESVLLTDTVGFISKLPHGLVQAFLSTLEVVTDADLLVHVVDGSGRDPEADIAAVHTVLDEIGAVAIPELLVWNKADLDPPAVEALRASHPGSVAISARTGAGVDDLVRTIGDRLRALTTEVELVVPFGRGDVMAALHREGEVLVEEPDEGGMRYRARLEPSAAGRFADYLVDTP